MTLPAAPRSYSTGADGRRVPDLAATWAALTARVTALAYDRAPACGHARGLDQAIATLTTARTYELGEHRLPALAFAEESAIGSSSGVVTVHVLISSYALGGVTYYAQPVRTAEPGRSYPVGEAVEIGTPSGTGWLSADVTPGPSAKCLRVFAVASSTTSQSVGSVCVLTKAEATLDDGSAIPAAWPKLSLAHMATADRPDDVGAVRTLVQQTGIVAATYPRTLSAHSLADPRATATGLLGDRGSLHHYKVARGPQAGDCTLWVYAQQDAASVSAGNGTISATLDGWSTSVGVALSGTSAAWYSLTLPAANWTANTVHDLEVSVVGGYDASPGSVVVYGIVLVEDAYDDADFLVSGDTAPTTWGVSAPVAEDPIVADYSGGDYADRKGDRLRLAEAALLVGMRPAVLVEDWLYRDATSLLNETGNPYGSLGARLWRTKRTPAAASTALDVWAQVRRRGASQDDKDLCPRFGVYLDGVSVTGAEATLGRVGVDVGTGETPDEQTRPRWVYFGRVAVTPGTTCEVSIRGGWVDATGVGATPTADRAVLDGACCVEVSLPS